MTSGRPYKMLTVLDEYTREALFVAVRARMGNAEVQEALYPLFLKHGRPDFIRSDNAPEFIAENFQTWLARVEIKPIRIYPGSPLSPQEPTPEQHGADAGTDRRDDKLSRTP